MNIQKNGHYADMAIMLATTRLTAGGPSQGGGLSLTTDSTRLVAFPAKVWEYIRDILSCGIYFTRYSLQHCEIIRRSPNECTLI